jgi:hypothetical protein
MSRTVGLQSQCGPPAAPGSQRLLQPSGSRRVARRAARSCRGAGPQGMPRIYPLMMRGAPPHLRAACGRRPHNRQGPCAIPLPAACCDQLRGNAELQLHPLAQCVGLNYRWPTAWLLGRANGTQRSAGKDRRVVFGWQTCASLLPTMCRLWTEVCGRWGRLRGRKRFLPLTLTLLAVRGARIACGDWGLRGPRPAQAWRVGRSSQLHHWRLGYRCSTTPQSLRRHHPCRVRAIRRPSRGCVLKKGSTIACQNHDRLVDPVHSTLSTCTERCAFLTTQDCASRRHC